MQTDVQVRHGAGAADRVGCGGGVHHQAGGGEDAVAMGLFYRLVDGFGEAEIVGCESDLFQAAFF
jgi:hypothetical protein